MMRLIEKEDISDKDETPSKKKRRMVGSVDLNDEKVLI